MSTAISTRTDDRTITGVRSGSAYPVPVAELAGRVREQAAGLQTWPSLRQVMTTHRVGRPKAAAALATLRADGFDPAGPDPAGPDLAEPADPPRFGGDEFGGVEFDVEAAPAEVSGLVSAAVDARPDTVGTVPPGPVAALAVETAGAAPAGTSDAGARAGRWRVWPLLVISLGAFVSIWGGWVGLGELTGFGPIRLLPGIADHVVVNTAITLPIGVEAYAAFALRAWLAPDPGVSVRARRFACWSAIGALALGAAGQIAYHLMTAAQITRAPWPITAFVSCLPVLVLGCGAALAHLTRDQHHQHDDERLDEQGEDR